MKRVALLLVAVAAVFAFIGCGTNPFSSISDNGTSVAIALPGGAQAQTITVEAAAVASGEVTLTKDATGESLVKTGPAGSTVKFSKILPGAYTVRVKLLDAAGELLYEGTAAVTAVSGTTVPVSVTVTAKGGSVSVGVIIDDTDPLAVNTILWNTLNDAAALSMSEIGNPGSNVSGTAAYTAAVHGGGVLIDNALVEFVIGTPGARKWGVDEITIEFWARTLDTARANAIFFDFLTGGHPYFVRMAQRGSSTISFVDPTTPFTSVDIAYGWNVSASVHFAVSISRTTSRLYIDGVLVYEAAIHTECIGKDMPTTMMFGGDQYHHTPQWKGIIDNIKVFSIAKTNFSDRTIE